MSNITKKVQAVHYYFNEKIIKYFKDYGIPVEQIGSAMFILKALYENNIAILDYYDDNSSNKAVLLLYEYLKYHNFIKYAEDSGSHFELTQRSIDFFDNIYKLSDDNESVEDISSWIQEYINLFPSGIIEGKKLRNSSVECISKMKNFIKKYNYEKDLILKATALYLKEEGGGNKLTRNSKYFIEKYDKNLGYISDLLEYCERLSSQESEPVKFNEDVI